MIWSEVESYHFWSYNAIWYPFVIQSEQINHLLNIQQALWIFQDTLAHLFHKLTTWKTLISNATQFSSYFKRKLLENIKICVCTHTLLLVPNVTLTIWHRFNYLALTGVWTININYTWSEVGFTIDWRV